MKRKKNRKEYFFRLCFRKKNPTHERFSKKKLFSFFFFFSTQRVRAVKVEPYRLELRYPLRGEHAAPLRDALH